jgi:phosphoenolpyruvate carboxylase
MEPQLFYGLQQFKNHVGLKFQLYNSLFTSLPFHRIEKTGILLSLLLNDCEEGYKKKQSPTQIIETFFQKYTSFTSEADGLDLLFRFVQYVERQVVLFDALEDAAFKDVNDLNGTGTLKHLESEVVQENKKEQLTSKLKDFAIRLVLTAHPTQFYPGPVLGIINDLGKALVENNTNQINMYLQQLGKTPFFKKQKPTPYDEAVSLIWYLENVFYVACGRIITSLKNQFPDAVPADNPIMVMGFWPGGDKDGNPNVTAEITLEVANALRGAIIRCYYLETRRLKRRLTFAGVDVILADLEKQLYNNIFIPGQRTQITKEQVLESLNKIREILIYQHNGLFLHLVNNLVNKVHVFGLHFASLDVRQESSVHGKVLDALAAQGLRASGAEAKDTAAALPDNYASLTEEEKVKVLTSLTGESTIDSADDPVANDALQTVRIIKDIQLYNGEQGCNRYIISQCHSVLNILEVYGLFLLGGWKKDELYLDIVPLFETVEDLKAAPDIMRTLYSNETYRQHLQLRQNRQTIMLGFSDGTKDGGYLMANWGIYVCKKELTSISREYNVDVVFFDGRGGPPARGGGKTHKFYASMGKEISNQEIQLTIQGQTVSSNFGTIDSAQYNIEQLLHAGISNALFSSRKITLEPKEEDLVKELADTSYKAYAALKDHPDFTEYLVHVSPLRFYADTNIGSRPARRNASSKFTLKDLRAIPFVGAWSQLKQNVTGYYGVGSAFQQMDQAGRFAEIKHLYKNSLFFKTLVDNCEMAMKKCFFPLTAFLSKHPKYGELWNRIYEEYELTLRYIFLLSGKNELMADYPVDQLSIQMRERIVLPLATIQQFAITKVREMEEQLEDAPIKAVYEKLAMRASFGIINAGRNSA